MKKILGILWKYKYFLFISLVIIIYVVYTETGSVQEKTQTEIKDQGVAYESIIPGEDSESELIETFGNEISSEETDSQKVNEYESTSPVRNHQAIIENEKVSFIKQIISVNDALTSKDLTDEHGIPEFMLYDKTSPNSSFFLFVYPGKGLAYLGHDDGTLLEVWYFPPTNITDFINKWANDYSFEMPPPIQ
jgi:hypothetical protein